jgi:CHAT domain-containing protein
LVQRALTSHVAPSLRLLDLATTCDLLPADAVLLFSHLTHSPGGGRSLVTLMVSKDRIALVPNQILDAGTAGQTLQLHIDNRVRTFDTLASTVFDLRQEVQAEPGPFRMITRSGEDALDNCLALFGPVADLLREEYAAGRRHLVIVPHGPLHFAPLHLLHLDGRPLAEAWTVTYLPNIALLERLMSPPPHGKTGMAAVGLGFAEGPLSPIPEAVQEAEAVAAKFGSQALLDADATENAVFEALAGARLFHIATHGVHNVAAPAFQSLYVADERVSAHELLRLDLHGLELVTLSACETALGRFDAADNLRGIPAHLLLRGASAVVGTLWPVESQTSRDFFTTLYEMLHDGSSKLTAFAAAQKRTRAAHPQYRDWGAFYYMGDWR